MSEPQEPTPSPEERKRRRERELRKVFGDVLPDQTSDDRSDRDGPDRDGPGRDDEWLRGEVPPHHG